MKERQQCCLSPRLSTRAGAGWWRLFVIISVVVLWAVQPGMALVVSELMYHPVEQGGTPSGEESLEFIELYNNRAVSEDLSGYAFTNGIEYTFAGGTMIVPKGYLVVAHDPAAVEAAYGISGVLGPFTGRLNNDGERIELSNCNGEIIISFRYNDTRPWPSSPDGTGHSLILAKPGGDPEEGSTWAPSTFIDGTPGGPDESQVGPEDPTLVTLVDVNHPGRYFKGTQEPSPGPGGEPNTDWTKIGFNDDPGTTAWLAGFSGYGYSDEADELQWIRTTLDMPGKYISVYARLRFALTSEQISSFSKLLAEVHYDDGFVLYLNGTRVAASAEIVGNPPPYNQSGGTANDFSAANVDLTSWKNLLVAGTNVLAIQGHNATLPGGSDCVVSPVLRAVVKETEGGDDPRAQLVINELLTNSHAAPGLDWLELYNPGPIPVDLNNVYLSDGRFELLMYKIPGNIVLQPGEFWAVREGTPPDGLPFGLGVAGETIFLTAATREPAPKPVRVLDALRFGPVERDRTLGRFPDGADYFGALSSPTFNGPNARPLIRDIVINEIMYNHATGDDRYEYVELHNRGASTVPLSGLAFTDGIDYEFGQGVQMSPGSYIVVAKDPNLLVTVYNNLVKGSNLFGPYSGELDNHSEHIRLSFPIEEIDPDTGHLETYMVTADEATYYDGGRWPTWADGQGASLELRDPRSNNNTPDAWADSNESSKTTWKQFSFTINSSDSQYKHDSVSVFDVILLNRGEILLDDLELNINSTNRLTTNNGFESGESGWRILGNHVRSFVTTAERHSGTQSLHLISTGHGDPGANRINRSITSVAGGTVEFKGWARWLRGSRYLLLRVTQPNAPVMPPRPSYVFALEMPLNIGTPGKQNTAFVSNRGPDIIEVRHTPILPADSEPIVVTTRVVDNDGVNAVTLYYRSEGTTAFTTLPMVDNGSDGDLVSGDGIFTATIPGAPAGTMRAFYITASDGSATMRFPTVLGPSADVPNRTCLVRVGDAMVTTRFATYRIWLSNDVVNTFLSRANLSNELMDCTFVYNNTEVFYNAGIRFRGSPFVRSGSNRDPRGNYAYRLNFNSDQRFRGNEEINLDTTEGGGKGPLQERASYWFYRQMGLQFSMQDFVRPIINGNNYANYEDVQNIEGDYAGMWFPGDSEGYLHKIDDYFEYSADGTGYSNIDEGLRYDATHPPLPETYRWHFEKRSHRENDSWSHFFNFAAKMNTSSSNGAVYEAAIESVIDPAHFAAVLALRHACGDWDSYGYSRGKNNYFYYALPEGRWYLLPWDIDFTLGSGDGSGAGLFSIGGQFPEVSRFLNYPKYRRMYLEAFARLVYGPWKTSYGTADPPTAFDRFLDDAANALIADGAGSGRRDGIKQFVRDRRAFILTQINIPSPLFEITTNGGSDFCTTDSAAAITGVAPLEVTRISINGASVPAGFSGNNVFTIAAEDVPLAPGVNVLALAGLDFAFNPVPGATDTITITRVTPCAITEITPNPVFKAGAVQLTIHGSGFGPGTSPSVELTCASEEVGFDALYVQSSQSFDRIEAATVLLDDPAGGVGDETYAVHEWINLWNSGLHGEFSTYETGFSPPFGAGSSNFAVRFSGYIYAPSGGIRYFGVNSDEGFALSIDGQLVGAHPTGRTAATTDVTNVTTGTMTFNFPAEGSYYLELDYFENVVDEEIELFQTNSTGGNRQLINHGSELKVYRDITKIKATDVVVVDVNTITCQVNLAGARADTWNLIVTPECEQASVCNLDNALQIVAFRADFNHDTGVDFLDWTDLAGIWRQACSAPTWCGGIDLDKSGIIGFGDVRIFAQEWLLAAE